MAGKLASVVVFLKGNWVPIRSVLIFVAIIVSWIVGYPRLVAGNILDGFLQFTAQLTAGTLRILGNQIEVNGTVLSSQDFSMRIGHECSAIVPMILLIGAILAYPSWFKQKPLPLVIGIVFLFILNQVRTSTLYYIGIHLPSYFEIAHFVVWQSIMILAVVIIWLLWVGKIANVQSA